MIEIDQYIISTVKADGTMKTLLGISASDNRIYAWYPSFDITYDNTHQAALVFRNSMSSRPGSYSYPSQIPNINYFFRCMSIDQLVLGQVSERLMVLFDDKYNVLLTALGIKKMELIGKSDAPTEGDPGNPIYVKLVSFSFSSVVKRS